MTDRHGHTERDYDALVAAGVDPYDTQPREHKVACFWCSARTRHQSGGCDAHYLEPWRARTVNEARQAVTS